MEDALLPYPQPRYSLERPKNRSGDTDFGSLKVDNKQEISQNTSMADSVSVLDLSPDDVAGVLVKNYSGKQETQFYDAIVSAVAERITAIIEEQIRKEVNLVRGVEKEILKLSDELKTIGNVLHDAERRGFKDKSIKDWLRRLEHTSYEMNDVLDEWNMEILKLEMKQSNANDVVPHRRYKVRSCTPSSCLCFKKVAIRRDIASKIDNVRVRLNLILAEKDRYDFMITSQPTDISHESWRVQSTSLINLEEVCGRDFERENLVSKLVCGGGGSGEELGIPVYSIVGVGGLGKTTLAQLAYNDSRVKECFELRIWICVSDPFNEVEIANGIIEIVGGRSPDTKQLDMILTRLKETISGKKFLLVLDDVWTQDYSKWEPLKMSLRYGGVGSKILVTTRNERVAIMMGSIANDIHHLGHLSREDCWLLLSRIALSGMNNEVCEKFESIGKKIAKKCKGLPLAAKTLGSLLRFKNRLEEWENVLNSEIWDLEEVEVELFPHLLLSYNELSPMLKRCFSYCSIFPKDSEIDVEKVITKWMALGYLESNESSIGDWQLRGRDYFDKLAMRSLFQDFKKGDNLDERIKSFKMHDILHDFAQFLRKDSGMGARMKKATCKTCSPPLVSHVKQYRSLLRYKGLPPYLCDCLTSLRLLGLRSCGLLSIPKEIKKLIRLRWLDLGGNKFPDQDLKTICKLFNLQFLWLDWCGLKEIPIEIENLIHLKHLDLNWNNYLEELPESICRLRELESLNVDFCERLFGLPEGIHMLTNLKHLSNHATNFSRKFPQGVAELTSLRTLSRFNGGFSQSKLGWLKNLNRLSGSLLLGIELGGDSQELVEDAREAELREKIHIQKLELYFLGYVPAVKEYSAWMDLIDALQPHPNLQYLEMNYYWATKLPEWIASPLNQLTSIKLFDCKYLVSLPPLGKLPLLENLRMYKFSELQFVGREFLGISSSSSGTGWIGFPKLKTLTFWKCPKWKEWEDITAEEEDSDSVSLMPCLEELSVEECGGLTKLPHRVMRKALALERLDTSGSTLLKQTYADKEGEDWKSISHDGQLHDSPLRIPLQYITVTL